MLNHEEQKLAYNYARLHMDVERMKTLKNIEESSGSTKELFEKRYERLSTDLEVLNNASVFSRPKLEDFDKTDLANLIDEYVRSKGLNYEEGTIEDLIETLKSEG